MPNLLWTIALHPSVVTPATAGNPATISPVSYRFIDTPADLNAGQAPNFLGPRYLQIGDVLSFTIIATLAPPEQAPATCPVQILPQGWVNAGCPPTVQIDLADLGVSRLRNANLGFGSTTGATPCHVLACHFHGSGIFTCSGNGVALSLDLNGVYAGSGIYLTCVKQAAYQVEIKYANAVHPTLVF